MPSRLVQIVRWMFDRSVRDGVPIEWRSERRRPSSVAIEGCLGRTRLER